MGLEGFSNNASGGMSPGDHLYAKTFNKLATFADKAQVGPSDGVIFTATNGGIGMYIPQQGMESAYSLLQQFQIVVEGYEVAGNTTDFSIIRVVKGEVVWSPKIPQLPPPAPPVVSCTTQTTIENWYALPTFPIIDDDNAIFIGDGGIRVPKVDGVPIGIFIFKATNLPFDVDPIIVATPDFTPTCPVAFPGTPPVAGAFWEMVKIGSVVYTAPDPEADPPIEGGWEITQNFIGSMTLPGDGGQGVQTNLPAQLQQGPGGGNAVGSPFECWITTVNGQRYLQIATGTVTYSSSNMPTIKEGAFTHTKQAWFTKVQICPSGMRTNYNEMWPNPSFDPNPSFSNTIMEGGGGYLLSDTQDPIAIYAFKWDADSGLGDGGQFLTGGLPTLAILADSNSGDINKVTKDCGPSVYQQAMNIQSMTGYKASDTELAGDWGHCHTTWLNPRKVGYNYKLIAAVIPQGAGSSSFYISYEQVGVSSVCNTIQRLTVGGEPSGGSVILSYLGVASSIPFPVTTIYTPFTIISSDSLALFRTLNAIPLLTGNVQVSGANGTYYVTFINNMQGQSVELITANTSGMTSFQNRFQVVQYHTGNLDITTPMQMGMTQLMNEPNKTEADDPYNANKDSSPAWNSIINRDDCLACKDFSGDVTTDGVFSVSQFENSNPDFTIANGCTGDACEYPFQVHSAPAEGDTESVWTVCYGMVNNQVPTNIGDTFVGDDMFIYLAVSYDSATKSFPEADGVTISSGASVPASTNAISYIAIAQIVGGGVNQLVSGSLWGDRIQIGHGGTETSQYYYSKV